VRVDILTLFPEVCAAYLNESILKRAQEFGALQVGLHNIRDYATDKHRVTDDMPFGGGGGMVLKPEPVFAAVESLRGTTNAPVILLCPQGRQFTQAVAQELAAQPQLLLLAGRYEGIDERVREHLVTDFISIGDYVLTGGELPALVLLDAVARLLPGVLGAADAASNDSFGDSGMLEYPHYTRPADFRGYTVPEVLLSGDHAAIERWRRAQSITRTFRWRPDLLHTATLSKADKDTLAAAAIAAAGSAT
jgi:tRNA (guanine37-N1)-methyltransferase